MPPASSNLIVEDLVVGQGTEARGPGQFVTLHYTGRLADGTEFDSSRRRDEPFGFPLGVGMVIRGWDQGVVGMRVGGQRRLTIPLELGYGARGCPGVNDTFRFASLNKPRRVVQTFPSTG